MNRYVRRLIELEKKATFTKDQLKQWINNLKNGIGHCPCVVFRYYARMCPFSAIKCIRTMCKRSKLYYKVKWTKRRTRQLIKQLKKLL
jgi:hypothetical protein